MLQGLVCLLRDSDSLLLHSQKLIEGSDAADVVNGLKNRTDSEQIGIENGFPDTDDMPILPEIPQIPVKPVLLNMGLW